jgi:hypothetical protein
MAKIFSNFEPELTNRLWEAFGTWEQVRNRQLLRRHVARTCSVNCFLLWCRRGRIRDAI